MAMIHITDTSTGVRYVIQSPVRTVILTVHAVMAVMNVNITVINVQKGVFLPSKGIL